MGGSGLYVGPMADGSVPWSPEVVDIIRKALEVSEIPVMVVGDDGRVLGANRSAEVLAGGAMEELGREARRGQERKESFRNEVEWTGGGERRRFEVYGQRVPAAGGGAVMMWMFDVTEDRRLASRLLHSTRLSVVGQLATGIAHEFNNILAVIEGLAQVHTGVLRRRSVADPETEEILGRIINQAERAARIVRQIQDFAAPAEGKRRSCRLDAVVGTAVRLTEHQAELENIRFRLELEEVTTLCDEGQIEQVLMNLIQNARYALWPKGGGTITVRLRRTVTGMAELVVADDGVGMDAETARRVFEPFFTTRSHPSKDRPSVRGSGLGLAVCRSIVAHHGGTIDLVRTAPGEGSEFRILLPLHEGGTEGEERGTGGAVKEVPLPGRVLVVEAERDLAESLGRGLREAGVERVDVRFSAAEATEAVRTSLYDVLLLDVSLPDGGGRELIGRIRGIDPQVRIVCMTGRVDAEDEWRAWGAEALLVKPFRIDEMVKVLSG